jgi:hypothetical protein
MIAPRPFLVEAIELVTSHNKFYLLRAKDALVARAGRLFLCSSGRRSGHILACSEDPASQNVKVKPTFADIAKRYFVFNILRS